MTTPPKRTKREKASRIPPLVTGERLTNRPQGRRPRVAFEGGLPTGGMTADGLEETREEREAKKAAAKRPDHFELDTSTLEKIPEISVLIAQKRGR